MADLATLSIKVDASGAVTGLDQLGAKLGETGKQADSLSSQVGKLAAVFAGFQAAKFAQDTLNLGARYETLGVVMNVVGRSAGKTRAEMDGFQASLQKTGISMIGARESLAQMAGAQLDLAKASGLARVAQNAAVIANINSSEAFSRLINGITTGQPEVLRTLGIFVDMKAGQKAYAESLGKSADNLTAAEKTQANMNTAMKGGVAIAGSYEAAMGTAGKQLLSTVRYMEDARVKASEAFQPAYTQAVFAYAEALKLAANNANTVAAAFTGVAAAIGAIVLALAAAKASTFFKALSVEAVALLGIMLLVGEAVNIFAAGHIENIKKAAAEQKRFNDEVAKMKAPQLTNLINEGSSKLLDMSVQGFGQGGKIAKEYAELEARVTAYRLALAQLGIVAGDTAAAHTSAMDELKKSKQEDANATQLEIDYAKKYWVEISKLILKKEELKKINEEIAARTLTTELPKIDIGELGFPDPGKWITATIDAHEQARLLAVSASAFAKEMDDKDAQSRLATHNKLEAAKTARTAEAEKQNAAIRENFVKQLQQTFATGIANMLENGLSSWRSFFDSIKSMFLKLVADMASARVMAALGVMGEGNKAGGVAMAGFAGGAVGYGVGGMTTNKGLGALGGAASGAATGAMMAGPIGAVIGGLAGLVGGFMGSAKAAREAATRFRELAIAARITNEDYDVRRLRAQGKKREADELAFKFGQARERDALIKSFGSSIDQMEFATLANLNMTQAAEAAAFALNTLAKSALGMVAGYRYQAAIFAGSTPRGAPVAPSWPTTTGGGGGSGGGGGGGERGSDLNVTVMMADGSVIGNAVIKDFRARAQRQFGDTRRWSEVS